ncbi:peptidoglycan editing factor PgeF [Rhodomicrobium sp. Az07]|uniref:peptidoglycan editing factor PgeF n=1 Tax=Rhodomicrobium sp. Az07 TaxID=2839034 RepID=UPI001BE7C254|nr:peptidoglycan editing factor PgeF [Rhodomicrobium sp. Az07]MBT3070759.1 peptidoglycan editing factor PgeF [Rhodomicrobium sp. Az07]
MADAVTFKAADGLLVPGIRHGFFLRAGGVSEGIYASLNCGRGSRDQREAVEENRARVASALGVSSTSLIGAYQIHSPTAVIAHEPWEPDEAPQADAVVTATPGLAVSVLTADCVPVLLADAEAGVVGAAHAGWKGAKAGILEATIEAMESLGAKTSRISAAIGPAISQRAYEVGPEFRAAFTEGAPENDKYFSDAFGPRPHFNLPAYLLDRLFAAGVKSAEDIGVCTLENESILFSYRRACLRSESDYGRQISAILVG